MKAVLDATRLTEKVLFFYGKPPKLQNPVVLHEHIKLFRGICSTIGKPLVGVACLESTQSLLGSLAAKQSDEVFKSAKDSLDRFQQWLREEFPVETGPVCNWPWTKALLQRTAYRCELCRRKEGCCHYAVASATGIERHEYCKRCAPAEARCCAT